MDTATEIASYPTPPPSPETQAALDASHLKMLSVAYILLGCLSLLIASFFAIHLGMGAVMLSVPGDLTQSPEESLILKIGGLFFVGMACFAICVSIAIAVTLIVAGRRLVERRSKTLCTIAAAVCCTYFPIGTVLGVCTLLVLQRPTVHRSFEAGWINTPTT